MKINYNKLINYLSCLIAFLMPWQTKYIFLNFAQYQMSWEYDKLSLYASDILLIILFLIGFKKFLGAENKNRYRMSLYVSAWIILLSSTLGIYTATNKIFVLFGVAKLFLAMSLWWMLINFKIDFKKVFYAFFYGAGTISVLSIYQFLNQKAFANKWLGLAAHTASDLGTSVVEIFNKNQTERWLRAYGSMDHPNILAGYLVFSLLIYLFLYNQRKTNLQKSNNKITFLMVIDLLILSSTSAALFFSFSRAGILALLTGVSVMLIGNFKNFKNLIKPITIIAISLIVLAVNYGYLYQPRVNVNTRLEQKSINERNQYIKEAINLINKKPLLGHSYNNYLPALKNEVNKASDYDYQPVHNFWLILWSETGIFSLLAMLAIFIILTLGSLKNLNKHYELKIFNISLLSSLLAISLLDHWLWSIHFGIIMFWFIIAIITKNLSDDGLF